MTSIGPGGRLNELRITLTRSTQTNDQAQLDNARSRAVELTILVSPATSLAIRRSARTAAVDAGAQIQLSDTTGSANVRELRDAGPPA